MLLEERANKIYKTYTEVICPYILDYELLSNKFPTEILNEIRAIFTHLSKYYLSDNESIKEKNIFKAERHVKRSILDCYKYICMAYEDEYKKFEIKYKNTDLSLVDNGEFLPKLLESRKNAINLLKKARKTDFSINADDEINDSEAYKMYEEAFVAYSLVYELINNSFKKLENLRKRAVLKDFLSVSGWIAGIIGIIITIISLIF